MKGVSFCKQIYILKGNNYFYSWISWQSSRLQKGAKRFSSSYNIITYDLLGHGDDKGEAIDFSLQRLVDQLLNLYEQEGIKKHIFVR